MGQDGVVRHATAVRRLRTIAARCQQASGLWRDEPVLLAAYAFGEVLAQRREDHADFGSVQVAFVLDLPPADLTWCCQPQSCSGLPSILEIDKAPVDWYWRPAVWPVSNHRIQRPLRLWSLDGPDTDALDALARHEAESLRLPEPPPEQAAEQLTAELEASLAHLRSVQKSYWQPNWRKEHRGFGIYPENHLWDAVHGYLDLLAAIRSRTQGSG